jgi:flagellar basal-body rod modification protein FlgD
VPTAGPVGNIADVIKNNQTATGDTVSRATNSKTSDKDMFLKLLLAQMKYQDPMKPTDSAQYLSQMAQFTTVEKLETMVTNTGSLLTASQMQSALGMVGATVEYGVGDKKGAGVVTGITMIDGSPQLLVTGADQKVTKVVLSDLTNVKIGGTTSAPATTTPDETGGATKKATTDPSKTDPTGTV